MDTQFTCLKPGRRAALLAAKRLNGIDYLEVASADQRTLNVTFLFPIPAEVNPLPPDPATLTRDNVVIEGGVRVTGINVVSVAAAGPVLTMTVDQAGDFSTYTLRLVSSPTVLTPPAGFDPQSSAVDFSFKAGCPSPFDCQVVPSCPSEPPPEPALSYLAKDYASFRRLMLDRLSVIAPQWTERNPADLQVTLVEMLAYVGDHLSYFQDAVATEAYLGTARRRISVRRHARLLNYPVNDGRNARAWVQFEVKPGSAADGQTLRAGATLLTRGSSEATTVAPADLGRALAEQPVVFESLHDVALFSANNEVSFYTWSDTQCCLPAGATRATLRPAGANPLPVLAPGDLLLLEEVLGPTTGLAADADPSHRHVVRLSSVAVGNDPLDGKPVVAVEWFDEDALPFPLCLTARVSGPDGAPEVVETGVARGNDVLADHGRTVLAEPLDPPTAPEVGSYRPFLQQGDVTFRAPYVHDTAKQAAAATALTPDPAGVLPAVTLDDGHQTWDVRRDLLASGRFAADFVVETERDGSAQLRFGDGILGARPAGGTAFTATYRVGNGTEGNVGAGALRRVVWDKDGVTKVRNPLPATGGTDPESLDQVRQFAPQAFRTQRRAVTAADYAAVAQLHPGVRKAAARFRWTGSWYTVFVTVERNGGLDVDHDEAFKQSLRDWVDRFRMAGYDVEINGPVYVPLDIVLHVCVKPDYFQADVEARLFAAFGTGRDATGALGFFAPDNFTFGQPVFLSQVYERAMAVEGVASVDAVRFQRWGRPANQELENGVITTAGLEVARLSNDPNFPENGRIDFVMGGGL
jgi:hypothetical protein